MATTKSSSKKAKEKTLYRYSLEKLEMTCEWSDCHDVFESMASLVWHVEKHLADHKSGDCHCQWRGCVFRAACEEEFNVHVNCHAFHTKIKSMGSNLVARKEIEHCSLSSETRNAIPKLPQKLTCNWKDCQLPFDNPELYYRHVDQHSDDISGSSVNCEWEGCEWKFTAGYRLREHLRTHTQEKLIACHVCGKPFSSRTKFWDHLKRQMPLQDQKYRCSHCSKVLASERLLGDHMRNHINHYKCAYCDMTCSTPSNLNNHMKYRHSNQRPFTCDFCDYKGKTQQDLRKHLRTHRSDAHVVCPQDGCSYKTRSNHSLTLHIRRKHEKNCHYICHLCEKKFLRGSYLTRHLIKQHHCRLPSGHCRFRYRRNDDGNFQLQTVRLESIELTRKMIDCGGGDDGGSGVESSEEDVDNDMLMTENRDDVDPNEPLNLSCTTVAKSRADNTSPLPSSKSDVDGSEEENIVFMTIMAPDGKSQRLVSLVT